MHKLRVCPLAPDDALRWLVSADALPATQQLAARGGCAAAVAVHLRELAAESAFFLGPDAVVWSEVASKGAACCVSWQCRGAGGQGEGEAGGRAGRFRWQWDIGADVCGGVCCRARADPHRAQGLQVLGAPCRQQRGDRRRGVDLPRIGARGPRHLRVQRGVRRLATSRPGHHRRRQLGKSALLCAVGALWPCLHHAVPQACRLLRSRDGRRGFEGQAVRLDDARPSGHGLPHAHRRSARLRSGVHTCRFSGLGPL
mmetsp:Transcript_116568/g.336715  ORF Transcript_116568/g.336715 Transcript_116568/m.336715 type:complete len:256 (-) Transcript_116568:253-1020(-)